MGKGTFSIEGITSNSVQVLLVPDTIYESYRVIVVDEETSEEFNEYSSSLSITVSGLSPSTDYAVNVIGQINGQGDASVGWWGVKEFTTSQGSRVYFEVSEVGSRYVVATFYDDDYISDWVRFRLQAQNEQGTWVNVYTSSATLMPRQRQVDVESDKDLTPNTPYRMFGQYGEDRDGYIRWRDAYALAGGKREDFTTKKAGGAHIYTTEWKDASVWIYCTVNGVTDWHEATPYIYSNGWKQTI